MKKLILLAAAVSVALLVGCSSSGKDASAIRVGVVVPLSGDMATYGIGCANGAELAANEINASDRPLGKSIAILREDDEGNPDKTVNAYKLLTAKDGIKLLVGSVTSPCTAAITGFVQSQRVLLMSPCATDKDITAVDDPYVFRVCYTNEYQGAVGAMFVVNPKPEGLGLKRAAVIYDNGNDYSRGLKDNFEKTFINNGGAIVDTEAYMTGDKDFNALITRLKGTDPEVIYLPDYYATVSLIAKQLRAQDITVPLIGADGWESLASHAGDEVQGGYYSTHYAPDSDDVAVRHFEAAYRKAYNTAPNACSALGYDAVRLLADAIKVANSTDPTAISNALMQLDGNYLTGHYTFNAHHDPIKGAAIIAITKDNNGKLTTKCQTIVGSLVQNVANE
jgi:branched-chain amino acid transport system substrate-binding protein